MTTYTVVMHDGPVVLDSRDEALQQAFLDSCSTFLPVDVLEDGHKLATVLAHPIQEDVA